MRKLFLFQNVSLDGYFEGPNHDISFFGADDDEHFEPFSPTESEEVDTILLGHRTYDLMKAFWPTPMAQETQPEIAQFMNENLKVVASHAPFDPGWQNVQVICENVPEEVRKLKEGPGKSIIIFGSNQLCVSLMPEGLIDEFQVLVNSVAIGDGTPLFKGLTEKLHFRMTETRKLGSGRVLLIYRPKK